MEMLWASGVYLRVSQVLGRKFFSLRIGALLPSSPWPLSEQGHVEFCFQSSSIIFTGLPFLLEGPQTVVLFVVLLAHISYSNGGFMLFPVCAAF